MCILSLADSWMMFAIGCNITEINRGLAHDYVEVVIKKRCVDFVHKFLPAFKTYMGASRDAGEATSYKVVFGDVDANCSDKSRADAFWQALASLTEARAQYCRLFESRSSSMLSDISAMV